MRSIVRLIHPTNLPSRVLHSIVRKDFFNRREYILPAAMPAQPELPRPAHIDHDSMLSRKFGKEVTNYFGSMLPHCRPASFARTELIQALP